MIQYLYMLFTKGVFRFKSKYFINGFAENNERLRLVE